MQKNILNICSYLNTHPNAEMNNNRKTSICGQYDAVKELISIKIYQNIPLPPKNGIFLLAFYLKGCKLHLL